ncbi:alpha-hydroxy-acid oxidizing protein [Pseudomonas sp. CDFA 553]|uniref:alpha-hydroxy acid oxidase n=1 Tax=Pseudomonas quasicaspiana TaxID=2829821 RepID=UPI001E5A2D8D|nr:alpha-hydroxy acid oxidase [Pseudomonas quasicaspiana]MCD5989171.1 alpha-hydroxy-acid oxidizing protein [Pseudomonas quasicaspiana]
MSMLPTSTARPKKALKKLLRLDDFEAAAKKHLPRPIFGYVAGAVEDNVSLKWNRAAFQDYGFVPRALVDISRRTLTTELFGHRYAAPFGIAPMGISALYAYRGDVILTQAAAAANLPMIMSGSSLIPLEDVVKANPLAWFQAYLPGDEANIVALIARVEKAGFKTLVITVDVPAPANRENNLRAGFSTPLRPGLRLAWDGISHPRWLFGTLFKTLLKHGMPHFENNYAHRGVPIISSNVARDFAPRGHLNWEHFKLIRKQWTGTLVIKGILHQADAVKARDCGVDGIIVSNHGGRQLDGAVSPLQVLPDIVEACPGIPVMLDSGVRRGTDVIKALALGARFVFVGRPFAFAGSVAGQAGVEHAIKLLHDEVSRDMAMLGVCSIPEIGRHLLMRRQSCGFTAIDQR